jgi:ABC-type cobalamin/Fe3+-siderophores transport system ATPase subunit
MSSLERTVSGGTSLQRLGIEHLRDRGFTKISGGERQ